MALYICRQGSRPQCSSTVQVALCDVGNCDVGCSGNLSRLHALDIAGMRVKIINSAKIYTALCDADGINNKIS